MLLRSPPNTRMLITVRKLNLGDWNSPVYAFYHPILEIGYHEGRRFHEFKCAATSCKKGVRRYLDKKDAKLTSNMQKHAKICWGEETVKLADETKNAQEARTIISGAKDGSITASFERTGKGKVTYLHRQHTRTETKYIVCWVAESLRPFTIAKDYGFQSLMKMVSRDVKLVFTRTRQRIAKMLQEYDGQLSFATDRWTLPNHKVFIAVSVHLEHDGEPSAMILDIVEVSEVQ
ncbi:hypothetical protein DFJ58DRAFT_719620 [Suillus subalutaceus]|uniref:uncharacterized protein n=1 Tax=Suillus subalutaceus TaxID=48586 RepID=UPI001B883674|nr:uncharacterized protein DFJ58DRAFT_719620 [Suillus subalutaceus]KAG1830668.1 hypothetical protein DFJ58DRAFT_719620 [Suillus subalutaceus]